MKEKIGTPIKWFACYMALMLFQTSYLRLGTISAIVTLGMTVITAFISGSISVKKFKITGTSGCLIIFIPLLFAVALWKGSIPKTFFLLIAQALLFIVLSALPGINQREQEFLNNIFILSTTVYAILTIKSTYELAGLGYIHGRVELFHSSIDPNFIGIPFVAATVLCLNNILRGKTRIFHLISYIIIVVAIFYTASRGNMLCFAITQTLVSIQYVADKKIKTTKKTFLLLIISFVFICGIIYFPKIFPNQWERMTSLGENADNGRFFLWQRSLDAWKNAPLFGLGIGGAFRTFGKATHNTYIQLLSETGIIGTILFILFIYRILKMLYKKSRIHETVLIGCLIQIFFLDALDNRCVWVLLCWSVLLLHEITKPNKL